MPISIDGSTGTITGITSGGLPDAIITNAEIVDSSITPAKLSGGQIGAAPVYGCRAWVNFDGTRDSTGASSTANTNRFIRASGNVTSVLRNGADDYTINFTVAMPDANFAVSAEIPYMSGSAPYANVVGSVTTTTSSVQIKGTGSNNGGLYDSSVVSVIVFR